MGEGFSESPSPLGPFGRGQNLAHLSSRETRTNSIGINHSATRLMIVIARSEATWQSPDKPAYYGGIAFLLFPIAAMKCVTWTNTISPII